MRGGGPNSPTVGIFQLTLSWFIYNYVYFLNNSSLVKIVQLDDLAGCEAGITAHRADIANAMYPVYMEDNSVCGQLSICYVREWTYEECVNGVGQIAGIISNPATVESVVAFLKIGHVMSCGIIKWLRIQGS